MHQQIAISDFSPHLFWDMDITQFDFELHKSQLVYKVVTYGMMHDWELLQKAYPYETLKEVALNLRTLDKVTLSYLAHFFKVDKTAFRCYTQSQSPQNFWNS
jgi:hypothetical protein